LSSSKNLFNSNTGIDQNTRRIVAGIRRLTDADITGQRHAVDNCYIHENYVSLRRDDISLCRTKTAFQFNANVAPIALEETYIGGNVSCTFTGWGYVTMQRGTPFPNTLQRATFNTITNEQCNNTYGYIQSKEICTLEPYGTGICGGYAKTCI
jgi:hypothetical protein